MVDFTKILPSKVFCCLDFDPGAKILIGIIILLRFICMVLGCFYGPYLYAVLPLGGLYLGGDILLLYTIFGSGLTRISNYPESSSASSLDENCDFKSQRIWIFFWLALNIFAIFGLSLSLILFLVQIGWWSMTHLAIHVAIFFLVLVLVMLLIYGQLIVVTTYLILKDAWVRGIIGGISDDEDRAGLTHNGKRVHASPRTLL